MIVGLKKFLSSLICVFVFGISVSFIWAMGVLGMRPLVVLSGSMEPVISTGSVVILDTKAEYEEIQVGDIITFQLGNGMQATHRVVKATKDGFITKGDANSNEDGAIVLEENFKGKVLLTIPKVGYVLSVLRMTFDETIAYLTDYVDSSNAMTNGGVNIELIGEEQLPEEWTAGTVFTKRVAVRNAGPSSCYVRIKAVYLNSEVEANCAADWNLSDFVYNPEDGYYYYKKILSAGEETKNLITSITIKNDMQPMNQSGILAYAEGYQTAGYFEDEQQWREFRDYKEAWEYYKRNLP